MRLLFDSQSVQVQQQKSSKTRLNTLLGALKSIGTSSNEPWVVSYTADRVTKKRLKGADVLVVLTRNPAPSYAYSANELEAIVDYVGSGGSLLLMTSHAPNMANDAPLAARFGITVHPRFVSNPLVDGFALNSMVMSGRCLNRSLAGDLLFQVSALAAHDSPEITAPASATSIATFPATAVVSPGRRAPAHKDFAILVGSGSGKVIVAGNSGIVGDYGNPVPACGLVPMHNNLLFFLNCVRFLAGLPAPSYSGCCPGQTVNQPAPAKSRSTR